MRHCWDGHQHLVVVDAQIENASACQLRRLRR